MKKSFFVLMLSVLVLLPNVVSGQVTIGQTKAPALGAILQLKDQDDAGGVVGAANATRGLSLPRVDLEFEEKLYPMFKNDNDYNTNPTKRNEHNFLHSGLVVYNTATVHDQGICPGVYMWDGQNWNRQGKECSSFIVKPLALYFPATKPGGGRLSKTFKVRWNSETGTPILDPSSFSGMNFTVAPSTLSGLKGNVDVVAEIDEMTNPDETKFFRESYVGVTLQQGLQQLSKYVYIYQYNRNILADKDGYKKYLYLPIYPSDTETVLPIVSNAKWKSSMAGNNPVVIINMPPASGGVEIDTENLGTNPLTTTNVTLTYNASRVTGSTAEITFYEEKTPKTIKDVVVSAYVCPEKTDFNNLEPGVVFKANDQEGNPFLYRTFGTAGTWMVTNVRATSYGTNISYHASLTAQLRNSINPSYQEDDPLDPHNDNIYLWRWAYPHHDGSFKGKNNAVFNSDPSLGLLYSTYAAHGTLAGQTPTTQGLCPNGWRVPTQQEWSALEKEIYNNPTAYSLEKANTFVPTQWNNAWDTAIGDRGSSVDAGHGRAMRSVCAPANWRQQSVTKTSRGTSLPANKGGVDIKVTGTTYKQMLQGSMVDFWTLPALGQKYISFYNQTSKAYNNNNKAFRVFYSHLRCIKN